MNKDYSDARTYLPDPLQVSGGWGDKYYSKELGLFVKNDDGIIVTSPDGKAWTRVKTPNQIFITGDAGRVGSFIRQRLYCPTRGVRDFLNNQPDFTGVETVIHCAGTMTDRVLENLDNMAISLNIARAIQAAPSVKRLIFMSSLTADMSFTQIIKPNGDTPYASVKRASEQLFSALADVERSIVCLRLGHYSDIPIGSAPPEHEVLRLNDKALGYYIDQAMKAPAGFHIWNAAGQL